MQEDNKQATTGGHGSWKSFIYASVCVLPLAGFTLLHLLAASQVLMDNLKFSAAFFAPVFPVAALLGLIFSGFALKQHPRMFPILTVYALVAIGHLLQWVLIVFFGAE
jgi:hypothetical protein